MKYSPGLCFSQVGNDSVLSFVQFGEDPWSSEENYLGAAAAWWQQRFFVIAKLEFQRKAKEGSTQ